MGWIQRFFAWLWGKILRRTGYSAMVDGVIIHGCGECRYNLHTSLTLFSPKAHYCMMSDPDANGFPKAIFDPCDIPEHCKCRVVEAA